MKKVYIIHGLGGSPNGGWRPWLMSELGQGAIYACALSMPAPVCTDWIKEIRRHVDRNKKDQIYLVGHSLGVPAILRYLEKTKAKNIKGVVLVSGPIAKTKKKKISSFLEKPFNYKAITSAVKRFVVIHGDNDHVVSCDQAETLAHELKADLILIKNGGHLNGSSGCYQLSECRDGLLNMMK